jgi:hypothetical protein
MQNQVQSSARNGGARTAKDRDMPESVDRSEVRDATARVPLGPEPGSIELERWNELKRAMNKRHESLPMSHRIELSSATLVVCVWGLILSASPAVANPPQIQAVFPLGLSRGEEVELTLTLASPLPEVGNGEALHGISLWSPQVALEATSMADSKGEHWTCRVNSSDAIDYFDLYLIGPTGISNPMRLALSDLPEVMEDKDAKGNDTRETSQLIGIPSVVNGILDPGTDRDCYRVALDEGQPVQLRFQSTTWGSSVAGALTLIDPLGREFLHDDGRSSEPIVSFVARMAGDYTIEIHERAYRKGAFPAYRLSVVDKPLLATQFPQVLRSEEPKSDKSLTIEDEPLNDRPESAPWVDLPADVCGQFLHVRDQDWFRIEAKSGEQLWFEAFGERLGQEMDLEIGIHDSQGKLLTTLSDTPAVANRSDPWAAATLDPSGSWKVPADGEYRLILRDLYNSSLAGPDRHYRLMIRREPPDPAIVVTDSVYLQPGQEVQLPIYRHGPLPEGHSLLVRAIDLPSGVTASEARLEGDMLTASLNFTADTLSPPWRGVIRLQAELITEGESPTSRAVVAHYITPLDRNPLESRARGPVLVIAAIARASLQ